MGRVTSSQECAAERSPEGSGIPRRRIVPEIVPWYGSNALVADLAIDLLRNPDKRRQQRDDLMKVVATLDRRGASLGAAGLAMQLMSAGGSKP